MSPLRHLERLSRSQTWVIVTVISFALHIGWGALYVATFKANTERRNDINALACSLATDAEGSLRVVKARAGLGLPGENLLSLNKTRLQLSALALCPNP